MDFNCLTKGEFKIKFFECLNLLAKSKNFKVKTYKFVSSEINKFEKFYGIDINELYFECYNAYEMYIKLDNYLLINGNNRGLYNYENVIEYFYEAIDNWQDCEYEDLVIYTILSFSKNNYFWFIEK